MNVVRVGDIVHMENNIVKLKPGQSWKPKVKRLGVVISVEDINERVPLEWRKQIGRSVTVLWSNGRLMENIAENNLVVVVE